MRPAKHSGCRAAAAPQCRTAGRFRSSGDLTTSTAVKRRRMKAEVIRLLDKKMSSDGKKY
jgi:hypothetical protein